jgi:peptidoglycan/xylan/chitin deacetylase (PgdA/CDA1 family)
MRRLLFLFPFLIALPLFAAGDPPIATILCYHEVDDGPTHDTIPRRSATGSGDSERLRYTATVENFDAQLDYLRTNGYNVIPLAELVGYLEGKVETIPPKAVVITVDDGWSCAYSSVYPELSKRAMPWTLFIYPQIVGHGEHALTWQQLALLARNGVDIESHSYSHPFLTETSGELLHHEVVDSRTELEKTTNEPVHFFCYPFGAYNDAVVDALKSSGYEAALTTQRSPITRATDPMKLGRYLIHGDTTLDEFKSFLIGN